MPETGQAEVLPQVAGAEKPNYVAKGLQFFGEALTFTRPYIGRLIGSVIISKPDYESTGLAVATGGVGVGDALDGRAIRKAAELEGRETTPEGARDDEQMDKKWAGIMQEAYVVRALRDKKWFRALYLFVNKVAIDTRDGVITELRDEAQELDVDVKANGWGKGKTGLQNLDFTFRNSPAARSETGTLIADIGQGIATGFSLFSGFMTRRRLKRGIAEAKAEKSLA